MLEPLALFERRLHPSAAFMPARVRSERQSLSNCANAASTPSVSLPVDVSSIGSVADRRDAERLQVRAEREVVGRICRVRIASG